MDFTGCTSLLEIRGAGNPARTINFGPEGLPNLWHLCVRDSTNLAANLDLSQFYSLQELFLWNCNQTGAITTATIPSQDLRDVRIHANHFEHLDLSGQKELYRLFANNNQLTNVVLDGCTNLSEVLLNNNQLPSGALDTILACLVTNATGGGRVPKKLLLYNNAECPSESGRTNYNVLRNQYYVDVQCDWPDTNSVPGGTNAITFVTGNARPYMQIAVSGATNIVWHWGDGTVEMNTTSPIQPGFHAAVRKTNYVIVEPVTALTAFGAYNDKGGESINTVTGLANIPNLNTLWLWEDELVNIDLTGCAALSDVRLAGNVETPQSTDDWINQIAAVTTVTNGIFYYNSPDGSCWAAVHHITNSPSAAAISNLEAKGWTVYPWCH